jgi:DNA helicase-2/ATP-dependent DNA helicase PcrA
MTAHSSKGLEYEVVFAPGFFEGAIPHHKSVKYPDELAEEARLTYVIFTRAIRQLRVSRPEYYITRDAKGKMAPTTRSRFFEPVRKVFTDPLKMV